MPANMHELHQFPIGEQLCLTLENNHHLQLALEGHHQPTPTTDSPKPEPALTRQPPGRLKIESKLRAAQPNRRLTIG
jgi:hypothetical protein